MSTSKASHPAVVHIGSSNEQVLATCPVGGHLHRFVALHYCRPFGYSNLERTSENLDLSTVYSTQSESHVWWKWIKPSDPN
ncbi:hypothetical protein CFRS1_v003523 [Colletotrichum fructicola]|nr:hypothetical protein CFRS1_v003523 [Colletotrichum fructicola]